MPATTYSRWERSAGSPEVCIPLRAAWAIADRLGCTIDDVVGRAADGTDARRDLNALYNSLSIGGQARLDEYVQYLDFRERVLAAEGR